MAQLSNKTGPFIGNLQPTKSRVDESRVWSRAKRPAPNSYQSANAFGKQALSTKLSTQGKKFGSESRTDTLVLPSLRSTGKAGYYDSVAACGKQALSNKPTSPRMSFGTSRRDDFGAMYNAFTYKPH